MGIGIAAILENFTGTGVPDIAHSLRKNIDGMDFSRFILIADRGICCYPNLLHVKDAGNGYIVSKSLLKSTRKTFAS